MVELVACLILGWGNENDCKNFSPGDRNHRIEY